VRWRVASTSSIPKHRDREAALGSFRTKLLLAQIPEVERPGSRADHASRTLELDLADAGLVQVAAPLRVQHGQQRSRTKRSSSRLSQPIASSSSCRRSSTESA
jgi:hypothetical protein